MNTKNLPPELKSYKEEFDFLHKMIGDLEWELATIYLGKKAVLQSDIDKIEEQLENYRAKQEQEQRELEREKRMQKAMLTIKKKFGKNAILKGMNLEEGATAKDRNEQIGGHKA